MIDNNNVDRLFRDSLYNYSEEVPANCWDEINKRLDENKQRRVLWIALAIAASFAMFISLNIGYYLGYRNAHITTFNNKNELAISKNQSKTSLKEQKNKNNLTDNYEYKNYFEHRKNFASEFKTESSDSSQLFKNNDSIKLYQNLNLSFTPVESKHYYISENNYCSIYTNSNISNENTSNKKNPIRWSFSLNAAPLYTYRTVSGENSGYFNSNENSLVLYSLGTTLNAKFKKLTISAGFYVTQMGQEFTNIVAIDKTRYNFNQPVGALDNINDNNAQKENNIVQNSTGLIIINNTKEIYYNHPVSTNLNITYAEKTQIDDTTLYQKKSLNQKITYIEIPLFLSYDFYRYKNLIVKINTGMSFNYLSKEGIYEKSKKIGYARDLRKYNFAGTVGISFNIPISQRVSFSIEPRLRYYINSIQNSNTVLVKNYPYSFGIYTGIIYSLIPLN